MSRDLIKNKENIKNFSIIAHIDHGKSTLADCILSAAGVVAERDMKKQILDSMDIEQERGITIKLNAVQIPYEFENKKYVFHLIDTPGHIDFTYEVSRSLAACEGALLIVDATQGIQAQTLANAYLAIENNLKIIPIINKIDLPSADVEGVKKEIKETFGLDVENIPCISAKNKINIDQVFKAIINEIPSPDDADETKPLSALVFDSFYDKHRGIIVYIRIKHGTIKKGDKIKFIASKASYEVIDVGINNPKEIKKDILRAGEVGWFSASIKSIKDVLVGDTVTLLQNPTKEPYSGYKKMVPMVFCGLYPTDSSKYNELREALEKLQLSDSSITFEPETSQALGFGYRCGFLGLLHMEVIQERLEREHNINLIMTAPSVEIIVIYENGEESKIDSPAKIKDVNKVDKFLEPFVELKITTPIDYMGVIMDFCQAKRGVYIDVFNNDEKRITLTYHIPLGEIVFGFFDNLKSISKGYATMDYKFINYQESKLVKVDILLNKEKVDAFSLIIHKNFAYSRGRGICEQLKEIIPRQNFEIPIQAVVGQKVLARETIKALRKNVIAKCYGGDITRKKKLLKKQKEGKKRMKTIGRVDVPQEAFLSVLKIKD